MDKALVGKIFKFGLLGLLVAAGAFFIVNAILYACVDIEGATETVKAARNAPMIQNIALAVACLGVAVYLVLGIFGLDKIGTFVLIGAGVVAIALLIVSLIVANPMLDALKSAIEALEALNLDAAGTKAQYYGMIFTGIGEAIVFGGLPVVYGVKKLLVKGE